MSESWDDDVPNSLKQDRTLWANSIDKNYLLVTNIPHFKALDGSYAVDELWHKDLQLHRYYIRDLELASPASDSRPPTYVKTLDDAEGFGTLTHVPMPDPRSMVRAILATPLTIGRLWRAVGRADVVHVGVAGWPYPLGWIATVIAGVRGKFLIVNVESAPWRMCRLPSAGAGARVLGAVYEMMARWCVNRADLPMFTQSEYRASLLRNGRSGLVVNASWIDDETILSNDAATREWSRKPASPLRLIFAGRLTASKGVQVVLETVRRLASAEVDVEIDVVGEGELLGACRELAASPEGSKVLRVRPPLPYDARFFQSLRQCHAVLVPSLADEQPRIIYDAYSQALPVIASDTAGIRHCTADGRTGVLVPSGDVDALYDAIVKAAAAPATLRSMGLTALEFARGLTHEEMHRKRQQVLIDLLHQNPKAEVDRLADSEFLSRQPVLKS